MNENRGIAGGRRKSPRRGNSLCGGGASPRSGGTSPRRGSRTSPRLGAVGSLEVRGRRVSARVRDRESPERGAPQPRRRRPRRDPEDYIEYARIQTPPPQYAEEVEYLEVVTGRSCANLSNELLLYYTPYPEGTPRFWVDENLCCRNGFQELAPNPSVLDLNGTIFLAADLKTSFNYYRTRVQFPYERRTLFELKVYPHLPKVIHHYASVEIAHELHKFNTHVVKLSRLLTVYLFDAWNTWVNRNYLRRKYSYLHRVERLPEDPIISEFKAMEDELKIVVVHSLRAMMSLEACHDSVFIANGHYKDFEEHPEIRIIPSFRGLYRHKMSRIHWHARRVANHIPKAIERVRAAFLHSGHLLQHKTHVCAILNERELKVELNFAHTLRYRNT